ncbi:uncharacterized protein LOC130806792 [Amaranthus tricolor]|uniref:uncharacterized protein LOC130806792 n=1 Tax=Amaranthus tricolor TaxID=29722 RepID=UPI0025876B7C|nr:uncharacterized protein LOC130806792 [Amaranthus tricolor]
MNYHQNFFLKPQNPCTNIIHHLPFTYSFSQAKVHKTNHIQASSSSSPSPYPVYVAHRSYNQDSCRVGRRQTRLFSKEKRRLQRMIPSARETHENTASITKETQELKSLSSYKIEFKTLGDCKLGIGRYPDFEYDAKGGFGTGIGKYDDDLNGKIMVNFDVDKLYVPPLTSGTTKFLGLPLPPFLRIDIVPDMFSGSIDKETGKIDLEFKANFWFSMGTIYKAPPLLVSTMLTSEESQGKLRKGRGKRLEKDGKCKLVGVATVDPIDDTFMNTFLSLPTECLAILNATISLS